MNAHHVKNVSHVLVIYEDMSEHIQGKLHMNAQLVKKVSQGLTDYGITFLPTLENEATNAQSVIEDSIEKTI
jgi:hypothetical protein